jgi:UDP-N-acetylmuramyl pentapeptide phosphotransferase/UDP-N-acetylglucosamine-1-phosphate transferase
MYYSQILSAFLLDLAMAQTIDEPNDQKRHNAAISRLGGFAFFPVLFFYYLSMHLIPMPNFMPYV